MSTTIVFTPLQLYNGQSNERTQVTVQLDAQIISANRARRMANSWLLWHVGERIAAGEPELIIDDLLMWRFPLCWTSPTLGKLAELGVNLYVDAVAGKVLDSLYNAEEVKQRVKHLAGSIQAATN